MFCKPAEIEGNGLAFRLECHMQLSGLGVRRGDPRVDGDIAERDQPLAIARCTGRLVPGIVAQPYGVEMTPPIARQIERERVAAVQNFDPGFA
jgi:hypothetical protein